MMRSSMAWKSGCQNPKTAAKPLKIVPLERQQQGPCGHPGIWIDPLNSNHILNGNDGGVNETWDGGKHWSQKETISAQQFYDISVDNLMPYNVMGGTQDNGCWMGPSAEPQFLRSFPGRLDLPSLRRRILCRSRLVESRVHLFREPVRRIQPDESQNRRNDLSGYRNTDEERAQERLRSATSGMLPSCSPPIIPASSMSAPSMFTGPINRGEHGHLAENISPTSPDANPQSASPNPS